MDPNTTPALAPPPGQRSNFVNPYNQIPSLIATSVVCLTLVFLSIAARIFVKSYILRKIQLEDYVLIFTGFSFAAFTGLQFAADNVGQGRHQWDVSLAQAKQLALLENIPQILYCPTMFCAKLAVLLQMMRIFKGNRKDSVYWSIQVLIWTNFVFYAAIFFGFIFDCVPRAKIQDPTIPGHCISTNTSILSTSVINIISDFTILLLPVFAVWKLKIALQRKVAIAAVFSTGLFACVASILRLVYSVQLIATEDQTYTIHTVVLWGIAEITTVILAGAFPTLPRLLQWFASKSDGSKIEKSKQQWSKSSYVKQSREQDAETGMPWDGTNSTARLANRYVPLDERKGNSEEIREEEHLGRVSTGGYLAPLDETYKPVSGRRPSQIQKTIRIETGFARGW